MWIPVPINNWNQPQTNIKQDKWTMWCLGKKYKEYNANRFWNKRKQKIRLSWMMYMIFNLETSLLFWRILATSLLEKKILRSKIGEVVCLQVGSQRWDFFTKKSSSERKLRAYLAIDRWERVRNKLWVTNRVCMLKNAFLRDQMQRNTKLLMIDSQTLEEKMLD